MSQESKVDSGVQNQPCLRLSSSTLPMISTHDMDDAVGGIQVHFSQICDGPTLKTHWYQAEAGYDLTHFSIDWEAETVTCPQSQVSSSWTPVQDAGKSLIKVKFSKDAIVKSVPVVTRQTRSGRTFKVIGEIVYELMSDGSALRRGSSRKQTVTTIHDLLSTAADLRARWLIDEQGKEILDNLGEEGIDLGELAYSLHLMELDPLDLLLHVVFQEPIVTRTQRVKRLRREQTAFFKRYEKGAFHFFAPSSPGAAGVEGGRLRNGLCQE